MAVTVNVETFILREQHMSRFQLAQVNIGRLRAPLEDPLMEGFRAPAGRHQRAGGSNARVCVAAPNRRGQRDRDSAVRGRAHGHQLVGVGIARGASAVRLSQRARRAVARPDAVVRVDRGADSRDVVDSPPDTSRPLPRRSIVCAIWQQHGPSAGAFTFRQPFPPPGAQVDDVAALDREFCEWAT